MELTGLHPSVNRRDVLKMSGAFAAAGVAGCLHEGIGITDGGERVWRHPVGARVEAAFDGRVLGREDWRRGGTGGVVALDAGSGDRLWRYGETHGYSTYTPLEFDGSGVYFGWADDAVGSGDGEVYALDLDGEMRWKRDVGSVYSPPVVDEGVVYVGSDRGRVYAYDAASGDDIWSVDVGEGAAGDPSVETVVDGVAYVAGDEAVHAFDSESGDGLWSYGEEDVLRANGVAVQDGVVYVTEYGGAAAVDDGEEVWRRELEGNQRLRGLTHGNLYVGSLTAVDPGSGETVWRVEGGGAPAFADDAVYLGGDALRRVDLDGDVEWTQGFDDEVQEVERLHGVDGDVYAVADGGEKEADVVHRVSGDGEVEQTLDSDGTVTGYVVDDVEERLYVGTIDDVKAYET